MNILTYLNGKKTVIGAVVLFAAVFLHEVVAGIWGVQNPALANSIETLNWIGGAITGIGLAHKGVKEVSGEASL